jgi:hypothetical protein
VCESVAGGMLCGGRGVEVSLGVGCWVLGAGCRLLGACGCGPSAFSRHVVVAGCGAVGG